VATIIYLFSFLAQNNHSSSRSYLALVKKLTIFSRSGEIKSNKKIPVSVLFSILSFSLKEQEP